VDTDPAGTAPNRVSSSVIINGRTVRDVRDVSAGRGEEALQAALTLEAKRSLLAALQASDLPPTIAKIIDSLDVNTASEQAIDDALSLAQTFSGILQEGQRNFVQDAQDLYTASTRTSREALQAQGQSLITLANQFDGSAQAATNLATAQHAYYQSLVQLLAGIQQMKHDLDSMFAQTRQHIETAGLSPDETFQYLQNQADNLYQQLLHATSPDQVQDLARRINEDYNQAFDLLSPEQQAAHRQEFLDHEDMLANTVHDKLDEIGQAIAAEASAPFTAVADKLGEAANDIKEAAAAQKDAAAALSDAANHLGATGASSAAPVVIANPAGRRREAGV
jgi:hypothetical protein